MSFSQIPLISRLFTFIYALISEDSDGRAVIFISNYLLIQIVKTYSFLLEYVL